MVENDEKPQMEDDMNKQKPTNDGKREASWPSVLFYIHLNILGLYGILVLFTHTKLVTILFCEFIIEQQMNEI